MSDIIHLLPDSVANQIAAGEVIQRPSSVVKELVENAVDAGATRIDVVAEDAGRTLIRVVDNGKGMSETDARLAFERHSTSKITTASDLYALHTMGFRGEALASIAAVAQVELNTRLKGATLGTCLHIEASHVISQEPTGCEQGSDFSIRNLFFNVPARRKFLKTNQTELNNIMQEFERVALTHSDIAFTLTHNGSLLLSLPIVPLRQRIIDIFGEKINQQLLTVEAATTIVRIKGFVTKPESARKKGARQFFFVNNRFMRHPYFHKAVTEAFNNLIPAGEMPSYFLYFEVDPSLIDVNIHPQKTEIKFENEAAIWQILVAAVKESLGRFHAVPTIDFDMQDAPEIPVLNPNRNPCEAQQPRTEYNPNYNPFGSFRQEKGAPENWQSLYPDNDTDVPKTNSFNSDDAAIYSPSEEAERATLHYQFKGKYIITAAQSGLMVIHQRRAHIRVLYDRYMQQMEKGKSQSQGLLFPELVQFSARESVVLTAMLDNIKASGFDVVPLGNNSYSINAVPAGTEKLSPSVTLRDIVSEATDDDGKLHVGNIRHHIALSLARSAAVEATRLLSNAEMEALVEDLFTSPDPNHAPDGKIIVAILPQEDIDRLFG